MPAIPTFPSTSVVTATIPRHSFVACGRACVFGPPDRQPMRPPPRPVPHGVRTLFPATPPSAAHRVGVNSGLAACGDRAGQPFPLPIRSARSIPLYLVWGITRMRQTVGDGVLPMTKTLCAV